MISIIEMGDKRVVNIQLIIKAQIISQCHLEIGIDLKAAKGINEN